MAKRCQLTGVTVQSGNNVSHSHRKTRRRFLPNLQVVSLTSDVLNQTFKLRIATSTLRTVDHNGGLDKFLLKTSSRKLTEEAVKIKRKIEKVVGLETAPEGDKKKVTPKKDKDDQAEATEAA
tara:strand:+ start:595 stop:960 length:366 start_codon:yes stop_codon:yes gene_type:complete